MPALTSAPAARVLLVSSISQGYATGLADLTFANDANWSDHRSYSLSKLCNAMLAFEFAERYGSSTLSFGTLDPGTVNTKMLYAGWGACGIDVSAADNQYHMLTRDEFSPGNGAVNGVYYVGGRPSRADAPVYDAEARRKLWTELEALVSS